MSDEALYVSKSKARSLWQEYRIYGDRLELDTRVGLMSIPFDHIEEIRVSESEVRGLLKGDLHLKDFRPALKLDWANFLEHIVIDKNKGLIKRVLITPDNIIEFKHVLERALSDYRQRKSRDND
mgnify:CR=1 FL=1